MRREWVLLMFAALAVVAAAAASAAAAGRPRVDEARDNTAAPVAVQRVAIPATGMRDEAAMVLVGTALIGLAAAVRRAA
jgi:LPXTG-motif cell wall-anchored protein